MLLREVVKKQWVQENRISDLTTEEEKPSGMGQQLRADGQKQARGRVPGKEQNQAEYL